MSEGSALLRLQEGAAAHGWSMALGHTHLVFRRGEECVTVGFNRRGSVRWAFLDSIPVEGRGKAEAVLTRLAEPRRGAQPPATP